MSKTTQKNQLFSVSQKYSEVFEILEQVDNKSEFICQAIIQKYQGTMEFKDDILEEKIRKILKSMIAEENLFIVSGNGIPNSISMPVKTVSEVERTDGIENTKETEEEEDDYLKSILKSM